MSEQTRSTHPLVLTAAIGMILLSLTGIAALLGWLPAAGSSTAENIASRDPSFSFFKSRCSRCGTVTRVQSRTSDGAGSGVGAMLGGVLGGVLGHQVGNGRGKDAATVVGAVGGAYAGNEIEKQNKRSTRWLVTVKLDEGGSRTFSFGQPPAWRSGDRVRIEGDELRTAG